MRRRFKIEITELEPETGAIPEGSMTKLFDVESWTAIEAGPPNKKPPNDSFLSLKSLSGNFILPRFRVLGEGERHAGAGVSNQKSEVRSPESML